METWHDIWERKGNTDTTDLKELNGYEDTTMNPAKAAAGITKILDIKPTDTVLEVGCGAGMIAEHLNCKYVGIDYSSSLVKKHIELLHNSVLLGEANNLIFKDNAFDKVFSQGVFHYFADHEYAQQVITEMKRVAREAIFIGDLPFESHREEHLLYKKEDFQDFEVSDGFYNPSRFNALLKL